MNANCNPAKLFLFHLDYESRTVITSIQQNRSATCLFNEIAQRQWQQQQIRNEINQALNTDWYF